MNQASIVLNQAARIRAKQIIALRRELKNVEEIADIVGLAPKTVASILRENMDPEEAREIKRDIKSKNAAGGPPKGAKHDGINELAARELRRAWI